LIVEIDVCHKPLLKAREFLLLLLLLLRQDDEAICGVPQCMEVEWTIGSIDEVGQAAPLYALQVR
jgi:hypothetical protein